MRLAPWSVEWRFDTEALKAEPGARITLTNTDLMQHNWVLCRPGKDTALNVAKLAWAVGAEAVAKNYVPGSDQVLAASEIINPGESGSFTFQAPAEKGALPLRLHASWACQEHERRALCGDRVTERESRGEERLPC
ncbi:MAG: plastocyanin/azurin family copper-binding protein, partial [Verrucomicrobiales bacterium]